MAGEFVSRPIPARKQRIRRNGRLKTAAPTSAPTGGTKPAAAKESRGQGDGEREGQEFGEAASPLSPPTRAAFASTLTL